MKRSVIISTMLVAAGLLSAAVAQTSPQPVKSFSSSMGIFAYPAKGQTPDVQAKDEGECYNWAVQSAGTDPFQLSQQKQQQQQQAAQAQQQAAQAGSGAGAKGAVGGAAAGALIGAIAGDAGKGAAIGAGAGLIAGRRKGKEASAQAQQQAQQQSQQQARATDEQMNNFKKAFGVCLEARGYTVK
jgi:hypothetical protein